MTDCEDLYNARIRAALEGDYTTWSLVWVKDIESDWGVTLLKPEKIQAYENTDKLLIGDTDQMKFVICKLSDGTLITDIEDAYETSADDKTNTSLSRYFVYIHDAYDVDPPYTHRVYLSIFKDGSLIIPDINLDAVFGTPSGYSNLSVGITSSGKYIAVYCHTTTHNLALFKGS